MRTLNNKGIALILSYLIIFVLLILGITFNYRAISDSRISAIQKRSMQAVALAEAGIDRAFDDLKQDFMNDEDWLDGSIGVGGPDFNKYYTLYSSTAFGDGTYQVDIKNVKNEPAQIWVRSTGTVGPVSKSIEIFIKLRDVSPWQNVIFAGGGAGGRMINGNVDIRGSVHILGENLNPTDFAMDMSGSALVGNNYNGMSAALLSKIPACPTRLFNGENVQTLDAEVRVRQGLVGLSGTGLLGQADVAGNLYKETLDGVYITDGYGGNQGALNVNSDNGSEDSYDLGDGPDFPSLADPYGGYATYTDYLRANALVINDPAHIAQLESITPNSSFSYIGPNGSITMDGLGNLTIDGIVFIDGGGLNMSKFAANYTINYTGKGSIYASEDVSIDVNLYTAGNNSYPANIIGVMTPNTISFSTANLDVMGIFYAENSISASKQTDVVGAFVSNYFDMGLQVPSIFYVPDIMNNMPPGMIGQDKYYIIQVVSWKRV